MVKLFSKNSNLCDYNVTDRRTDRQTDRQTTCDRNTALCTKVHRAVKTETENKDNIEHITKVIYQTQQHCAHTDFNPGVVFLVNAGFGSERFIIP